MKTLLCLLWPAAASWIAQTHVAKALFSITVSHAPASSRVAAGRLPSLSYDTLGSHCAPESAPCLSTRLERGLVSDSCGRERALWEPLSSRKSWR